VRAYAHKMQLVYSRTSELRTTKVFVSLKCS